MKGVQFLKVDMIDAFEAAKAVAGLARIDRWTSMGHLMDLWRMAVSMTPDGEPITGIFEDENPSELVESGLEWGGDRGRLYSALLRTALIRELGLNTVTSLQMFEIRGLKRYEELREKRQRDANRKRAERARNVSDGRPPDDTRTSRGRPRAEKRREENRRDTKAPPPTSSTPPRLSVVPSSPAVLEQQQEENPQHEGSVRATAPDTVRQGIPQVGNRSHRQPAPDMSEDPDMQPPEAHWSVDGLLAFTNATRTTNGMQAWVRPRGKPLRELEAIVARWLPSELKPSIRYFHAPPKHSNANWPESDFPLGVFLKVAEEHLGPPAERGRVCCVCREETTSSSPTGRALCSEHAQAWWEAFCAEHPALVEPRPPRRFFDCGHQEHAYGEECPRCREEYDVEFAVHQGDRERQDEARAPHFAAWLEAHQHQREEVAL